MAALELKEAEKTLHIAKVKYNAKLSQKIELNQANLILLRAKTNYIQSLYDYHLAYTELENALGK